MFKVKNTYVMFIQPGWILSGTVSELTDTHVTLVDAAYLESVADGHCSIGTLALETNPKNLRKIITKSHELPDGVMVRLSDVTIVSPCAISMRPLSRVRDADAIRSAT